MSSLNNSTERAWIGLSRDTWRWSLSDPSFYKPGETDFRRWGPGQPDVGHSGKVCTAISPRDGLWYDHGCDERRYPVCVDVRGSEVNFVIIENALTWTGAQNYCRAKYTDLASVRDMVENQKIQPMLGGGGVFWFGLFRDSWKWSDGSSSSFSFWKTGQPNNINGNQTCVAADFSQSGAWEGWSCDMERAFICYGPGVPVSMVIITVIIITVFISGLPLTIICIRRKCKSDGLNSGGNSDGVNMEVVPDHDYVNFCPHSTHKD
ncbi:macrophage mannose receptor 1-like [Etheostoma cragini]|uniref:macrophage mannose receptor 1-like n=1 Tax=Etheostoma cragini TaxID=417921 RepID=UPI00155E5D64|nr:macrophage mannose receptor 1-like [Etheostoma cragini]